MPTALISVYDKTGLLPLAEGLLAQGWRILATGGTLRTLQESPGSHRGGQLHRRALSLIHI